MNRPLSKRAAINIEPALTRINKMISDRIDQMMQNMIKYPAASIIDGIKSEAAKAKADIVERNTVEIRAVEQTLNTITPTNPAQSNIQNPFNNTPAATTPAAAPGSV